MKQKMITYIVVIGMTMLVGFFMWPLPLSKITDENTQMDVYLTDVVLKNGSPIIDTTTYRFQPSSAESKKIRTILKKYSYHRSLRTFFSDSTLSGCDAGYFIAIYFADNEITSGGTSEIRVNNRVYRIGYWGNKKAISMVKELYDVLKDVKQDQ